MAIALRGTPKTQNNNNGNDATLTQDVVTPPLVNDIIIVCGGHANTDTAALALPIGNTSGNFIELGANEGSGESIFGAWYQRMGATPDLSVVCDGGGNNADGVQYACWVISGVDTTTALDAAATTAGPTTSTDPNPPAIITVTANAWVFAFAGSNNRDTSITVPTDYLNHLTDTRNETNDQTIAGARIIQVSPDTEDPPTWTGWSSGSWYAITAAFRPLAAAGGSATNSILPYYTHLLGGHS